MWKRWYNCDLTTVTTILKIITKFIINIVNIPKVKVWFLKSDCFVVNTPN